MEAIFYIILAFIALYLFLLASTVIFYVAAAVAVIMGLCYALMNYYNAIAECMNFSHWEWEEGDEPAKRSYFFGPGYAQLSNTIQRAFSLNAESMETINGYVSRIRGKSVGVVGILRAVGAITFKVVTYISIYVIGTVLCALLGLIHGTITTIVMAVTYIIFSVVWLIDHLFLLKNRIRSDCPVCHSRFLIPTFMCPNCNEMHKKLVPGPYGIWYHRCNCGQKLPSTFLNGRSQLEAFCPNCCAPLVASDARPIVFQLIGGSKAGKTVYLSAFFHQYLEKLRRNNNLNVLISPQYQPYFDELEEWYSGADCPATAQLNSQMYPLLIDNSLGVRRQFSIYDIAGEMFDGFTAESEIQQQQFHYCDGLLFLLDPFSGGKLRNLRIHAGEDISDFSEMSADDVATNFINYLIRTGHASATSRCAIPIAVMIAKADVKEVKRVLSPARIAYIYQRAPESFMSLQDVRDAVCRRFLIDIGFSATVENLETQFSNLHYFPVSAMGHTSDGTEYEPWGIMDAINWMLPIADRELADLIENRQPATVQEG